MKTLIIISGLPGSGKTTLAKSMVSHGYAQAFYEADQFMVGEDGDYLFDPKKLGRCHGACKDAVCRDMIAGVQNIIVSNTSLTQWEVQPYIDLAEEFGYAIDHVRLHGTYGSIHGVPEETMRKMRAKMEDLIFPTMPRKVEQDA